jgi:hypothetical protein
MSDPELRELTASELLTLEEEYEMQREHTDHFQLFPSELFLGG